MDKEPPLVTGIGLDAARGRLDAAGIPLDVDTILRLLAMIFLMGTGIAAIGGADNIDVRDGDERAVDDDGDEVGGGGGSDFMAVTWEVGWCKLIIFLFIGFSSLRRVSEPPMTSFLCGLFSRGGVFSALARYFSISEI